MLKMGLWKAEGEKVRTHTHKALVNSHPRFISVPVLEINHIWFVFAWSPNRPLWQYMFLCPLALSKVFLTITYQNTKCFVSRKAMNFLTFHKYYPPSLYKVKFLLKTRLWAFKTYCILKQITSLKFIKYPVFGLYVWRCHWGPLLCRIFWFINKPF